LPLPHTRDATTLLCSTAYDDNWAESELRTQKKAAPGRWKLRQRLGTATLVTSNLLILAASNVLFPDDQFLKREGHRVGPLGAF
ncbi:MAG: hypothetical protein ACK5FF_01585, partial [Planctomyces sp.]